MIDDKTKKKLLWEIERTGIVLSSCLKVGVDKSTYYRWKEKSKKFKKEADRAEKYGRRAMCDIARHALMMKVKTGDPGLIKYLLSSLDPDFKKKETRNSKVTIVHRKEDPSLENQPKSFDQLLAERDEEIRQQYADKRRELTMFGDEIPPKPDGTLIEDCELYEQEVYIRNWQQAQRKRKALRIAEEMKAENSGSSAPEGEKEGSETPAE